MAGERILCKFCDKKYWPSMSDVHSECELKVKNFNRNKRTGKSFKIYVVLALNAVKIGISSNVKQRFSIIKSDNNNAELLGFCETNNARLHEKILLSCFRFSGNAIGGEWANWESIEIKEVVGYILKNEIHSAIIAASELKQNTPASYGAYADIEKRRKYMREYMALKRMAL